MGGACADRRADAIAKSALAKTTAKRNTSVLMGIVHQLGCHRFSARASAFNAKAMSIPFYEVVETAWLARTTPVADEPRALLANASNNRFGHFVRISFPSEVCLSL